MRPRFFMATWCFLLLDGNHAFAQSAPPSPGRPWQAPVVKQVEGEAAQLRADQLRSSQSGDSRLNIDPNKVHSLAELVDLAEANNPETRVAWEQARVQAAAL